MDNNSSANRRPSGGESPRGDLRRNSGGKMSPTRRRSSGSNEKISPSARRRSSGSKHTKAPAELEWLPSIEEEQKLAQWSLDIHQQAEMRLSDLLAAEVNQRVAIRLARTKEKLPARGIASKDVRRAQTRIAGKTASTMSPHMDNTETYTGARQTHLSGVSKQTSWVQDENTLLGFQLRLARPNMFSPISKMALYGYPCLDLLRYMLRLRGTA